MARRSVTGQLNMFDFFSSAENGEAGEVEMVSLMPNFEEDVVVEPEPKAEPEVISEPEPEVTSEPESEPITEPEPLTEVSVASIEEDALKVDTETPVMSRVYELKGEKVEVAYINYNKVRVTKGNAAPELHEFSNSKDAVDYYVGYMQEIEQ